MADRNFIIEILLQARDETARAFASAMGNMEAYDKLLDEQKAKAAAQTRANSELAKSHEEVARAQQRAAQGNDDVMRKQADYEKSVQRLTKAEADQRRGSVQSAVQVTEARKNVKKATDDLNSSIANASRTQRGFDSAASQAANEHYKEAVRNREIYTQQSRLFDELTTKSRQLANATDPTKMAALESSIRGLGEGLNRLHISGENVSRILDQAFDTARIERSSAALSQYRQLVDNVANAERKRDQALAKPGLTDNEKGIIRERLDVDVGIARARLDEFRTAERIHGLEIPVHLREEDIEKAKVQLDTLASKRGSGGSGGGPLGDLKDAFSDLDTSTQGFDSHIRNALGFSLVSLIQPVTALIFGLVGAFGALASAAAAAGGAIGTTFLSGMVQGLPVMGLFAASMQRLQTVISYVSTAHQQLQQQFIAQFQTAAQNAMGINQVAIAEHNYSNTLFQAQQALRNVGIAQLGLLQARQQAARQLQDLVMQEEAARLAAEASAHSVEQSQKALQQAIARGGDVAGAQIQLQQAQLGHAQAVTQASRAAQDAAPGSVARKEIQQSLSQAQNAVVQANRAVTDSKYAVAQARAAIIQAEQAAAGYSVATAAQLAWLRSQMTATERSLADNIAKIYSLFQGVNGRLRPVTDAILGAFVPLTAKIYQIFNDPKMFGALLNLGRQMGNAIRTITNTLTSNQAITGFINIINAAAANMRPLAEIVSHLFVTIGAVVNAAIPYVHSFLNFISQLTGEFSHWAASTKGQNWLKNFFDVAFRSLEAFINLGVAFGRLFGAIITTGGGAKAGIGILQSFTNTINRVTDSINNHGKAWQVLQQFWSAARPTLHDLGILLGAIGHAFLVLGGSAQGQKALQGMATLIARVLVPAFVQFALWMGKGASAIVGFLNKHPEVEKMLKDLIAVSLLGSVAGKAIGLLFGPLSRLVGMVGSLISILPTVGPILLEAFGNPVVLAIMAIVGAIVILAAKTGNMKQLWKTVSQPFVDAWNKDLKPAFREFQRGIESLGRALGLHLSGHKEVKAFLEVLQWILTNTLRVAIFPFVAALRILGAVFKVVGDAIRIFSRPVNDVFKLFRDLGKAISDLVHGRFGNLGKDFLRIGKDIVKGLGDGLLAIPKLLIKLIVDMVGAVLKWLGISSPSKRMKGIGDEMLKGLWEGLKAIGSLPLKMLELLGKGIASLGSALFDLGKLIIGKILSGIKSLAGTVKNVINDIVGTTAGKIGSDVISGRIGRQHGGPIFGYGGGDVVEARLEPGEHVLTKEEVSAAGGHGAIYALRSMLGGGGRGGPHAFAQGGQVGITSVNTGRVDPLDVAFGIQKPTSKTTQGVVGYPGGDLANIRNFAAKFIEDWQNMWKQIQKNTSDNINQQNNLWKKLYKDISDTWQNINNTASQQMNTLLNNFRWVYNKIDTDTFNAFWYINHATNASLKSFGAKPVSVDLGGLPKFAGGGFLGKAGERGKDAMVTVLGKGEAVLNWAHQKVVEPALNAFYGFGLGEMFKRTDATHAGTRDEALGMAAGGFSGYSLPLPRQFMGGSWSLDQGVDINGGTSAISGAPLFAIGPGKITAEGISGFGPNAPVLLISSGPLAGRAIYYGHAGPDTVPVGASVSAGQQISSVGAGIVGISSGPHLEIGFSDTAGTPIPGTSSQMDQLLHELLSGAGVTGIGVPGAGGAGLVVQHVKDLVVKGSGALHDIVKGAIEKVRGAANSFLDSQAGQAGGAGVASGIPPGPGQIVGASEFGPPGVDPTVHDASGAYGTNFPGSIARLQSDPQLFQQLVPHSKVKITAPTGKSLAATVIDFGSGGGPIQGYPRGIDLWWQTAQLLGLPANGQWSGLVKVARAARGMAGALAPMAGKAQKKAIPIIAHAGEWVLNEVQQKLMASRLGMSVENLKKSLGFTGGPTSFAGGGEVGDGHLDRYTDDTFMRAIADVYNARRQQHPSGGAGLPYVPPGGGGGAPAGPAYVPFPTQRLGPGGRGTVYNSFTGNLYGFPSANLTSGTYNAPQVTFDIPGFDTAAIQVYNRAQNAVAKNIEKNGKNIASGIKKFLENYNKVGGDNGLFAQAATAMDDFITQQSTAVQLAASGVKILKGYTNQRLAQGKAATAVVQAQNDLQATLADNNRLKKLQEDEVVSLHGIIEQIKRLGPPTKATEKTYQQLQGARQFLIQQIQSTDQKLAQGLADQYDKASALFQAQVDQALRGTTTISGSQFSKALSGAKGLSEVLSKVGPTIGQGLAQMAQGIAQALGDPNKEISADAAVLQVAQANQRILQQQYAAAAEKAQKDPRWQKIADDLLGQLESATTAVVQAQIQALQDAVARVDTQGQLVSAYASMFNRLAQVQAGFGNQYGSIQSQIAISRGNAGALQGQLGQYQGLLAQAQAQGDTAVINDLTQKITDLTAQVAEANLQTQQLITSYRQLSVTIQQGIASSSSGFFSAANQIAQTLGAIAGNQNLPNLIAYAKEAGASLITQGQEAVSNIVQTINDPNGPFGASQGTAGSYLGQLVAAFNQGPQAFATLLASLAPQLSHFEATLPQDQQTLFQGLIQSLIDNTTAQVENTQQLQQLNATTNQQQFTSSAWTMFREAIFNGLGGLLPQYAMTVPSMDVGGYIAQSGLLYGHKGETVVPASVTRGGVGDTYHENHFSFTEPMEVADPVYLGNAIAWRLHHDPNSR